MTSLAAQIIDQQVSGLVEKHAAAGGRLPGLRPSADRRRARPVVQSLLHRDGYAVSSAYRSRSECQPGAAAREAGLRRTK